MTLAVDISSFNETAFRHEVAALYGIAPSLVDIAASAGSTVISITIATSSADGAAMANVSSVHALMSDSTTVASLAAATGLAITGANAPATAMRTRSVELVCPAGHWCTAGLTVPCGVGYYNPTLGANNQTACIRCPENSITSAEGWCHEQDGLHLHGRLPIATRSAHKRASLRVRDGLRVGASWRRRELPGVRCWLLQARARQRALRGLCPRPHNSRAWRSLQHELHMQARDVPRRRGRLPAVPDARHACVQPGETIRTLPLVEGYWRARDTTHVLHMCYTLGSCPQANGSACAVGHSGPFCEVCESGFYRSAFGGCMACEGSQELAMAAPTAILIVMALALACWLRSAKRRSVQAVMRRLDALADAAVKQDGNVADQIASELSREADEIIADFDEGATKESSSHLREVTRKLVSVARRRGKKMATGGGVLVKLKIIISLLQVLNGVGAVFDIPFPPIYAQFLRVALSFEFNLPAVLPLDCWFPFNFHASLVLQTGWPLLAVILLVALSFGLAAVGRRHERRRAENKTNVLRASMAGQRASQADAALLTASLATRWSQQCLTLAFLLMFLVYPGNIARIFATFLCIDLPESGHRAFCARTFRSSAAVRVTS